MARDVQPIGTDAHGDEAHPAFGMIRANRVSSGPPGATLFDSEIRHAHYVIVEISGATRKRDLNHDWIHARDHVVEVAMSEAQWAAFVSSMGSSGVPCTLSRRWGPDGYELIPDLPYEPRLAQSVKYARDAADESYTAVREAFEKVKEKPTKAHIRDLEIALEHVGPNVEYAAKTLNAHVENVVVKARADIETMVVRHAEALGIEPSSYTAPLALPMGGDADDPQRDAP